MARTPSIAAAAAADVDASAPAHATWWAAAVYAISTLLLGYPALGGQFLRAAAADAARASGDQRHLALYATGHATTSLAPLCPEA